MAKLTITFEDDGSGGVNVSTTNDTPTPDPDRWTPAQCAFYAASAAVGGTPAQDLVVDGEPTIDREDRP
jgi:hypothetical protein